MKKIGVSESLALVLISLGLLLLLLSLQLAGAAKAAAITTTPVTSPSPTYDPLATPVLPANPSEYDMGKYRYYFDCMPCHGDVGQGLTDEFRMVWVEDHRNCWGRGCHAGRQGDEGFPIPTVVPAIIATDDQLKQFTNFAVLQQYLHDTHPPQYPGKLEDEQYRDLTVYLWDENHKPTLTPTVLPSPTAEVSPTPLPTATWTATPTQTPSPTGTPIATMQVGAPVTQVTQLPTAVLSSSSSSDTELIIVSIALAVIFCIALAYFLSRSATRS